MNPAPAAASLPEAPRPPRRILRRGLVVFGVLAAIALIAASSSPWWFSAHRVSSLALAQGNEATGLDWSYTGEPELRWRPQPWLSLPGLHVRNAAGRTVLAAERFEIAVPWSTLRGESEELDALQLVAPDLDFEAALAWWNARPSSETTDLPRLDGLLITRGKVRWPGGALQDIDLHLPRFAIDQPMTLELRGNATDTGASARAPFALSMKLQALPQAAPLRLENIELHLEGTGPIAPTVARGRLQLEPWALELTGDIAAWPAEWPALPAPLSASHSPLAFTLAQHGGSPASAHTTLVLDRDSNRVEASGTAEALIAWLEDADAAALPPLRVRAELPAVEFNGARLEGVTIELDGDTGAASAEAPEQAR